MRLRERRDSCSVAGSGLSGQREGMGEHLGQHVPHARQRKAHCVLRDLQLRGGADTTVDTPVSTVLQ